MKSILSALDPWLQVSFAIKFPLEPMSTRALCHISFDMTDNLSKPISNSNTFSYISLSYPGSIIVCIVNNLESIGFYKNKANPCSVQSTVFGRKLRTKFTLKKLI